jgi:hypothetical protein
MILRELSLIKEQRTRSRTRTSKLPNVVKWYFKRTRSRTRTSKLPNVVKWYFKNLA